MSTETHSFSADLNQLMSLIIHTFYSNKEVFLRELISNASDAINKARIQSLTDKEVLSTGEKLHIEIFTDKENKILTVQDTGIGMTKEDLINNLGTIAKSGTKEFMQKLTETKDASLIGQFGCGFYSAFLVADKVDVISKHNDDSCYMWSSNAGGSFEISPSDDNISRGTKIILHLKDEQVHYLDERMIKDLVKRHSEFTNYDISLLVEKTQEKVVTDDEEEGEEDNVKEDKDEDEPKVEEVNPDESSDDKKKTKKITEVTKEMEVLNQTRPIWTKPASENNDDTYKSFYKTLTGDWEDPLGVKQFAVEGQLEFKGILYIPRRAPFDLFETTGKRRNNIKLYVKQVFVTDDADELVPEWLRMVKGVVDSEDLPLNISREVLQQNKIVRVIRKNIIKKSLEMIDTIAEDKESFKIFYQHFSKSIKLGIHEDSTYRKQLAGLLRYRSTKTEQDSVTSLSEYISRMKENQKEIYFITGDSNVVFSPFLEQFKKRDLEVLFLTEPMDEYCVQQLQEYEDKKLVCITKGKIKFDEEEKEDKELEEKYKPLCEMMKCHLEERVEQVILSNKLTDSPCILSTSEYGWSSHMEKIMKMQALRDNNMNSYMVGKRTFEINTEHKIIKHLLTLTKTPETLRILKDLTELLYQTALMVSGFDVESPAHYAHRIHAIIESGLSIEEPEPEPESKVEEVEKEEEDTMEQVD